MALLIVSAGKLSIGNLVLKSSVKKARLDFEKFVFQSLDETTQHALTACVASFIYTKVEKVETKVENLFKDFKNLQID